MKNKIYSRARTFSAIALTLLMVLTQVEPALASSWSPTLLVNTESFQSIDDGDGTTGIELRFGTTGRELQWNATQSTFQFDANVEVQGTSSGRTIHAQDQLQSSGSLAIEGDAYFSSGIVLNGVKYTFPYGDGSATGKVLKTDGSGQLSWSTDNGGSAYTAGQGLTLNGSNAFNVNANLTGSTLEFLSISGSNVHAEGGLTSSGNVVAEGDLVINGGNINFGAATTIGDGGDQITIDSNGTLTINDGTLDFGNQVVAVTLNNAANAFNFDGNTLSIDALNNRVGIGTAAPDTALEIVGTASGLSLRAQDSLTSSGTLSIEGQVSFGALSSCTNLQTSPAGIVSCNSADYLLQTEIDTEADLELVLTDVTNVLTNNDNSDSLSEGATNLYFTNERVDDRVGALLQAGTGISLSYNDASNLLTISAAAGSGNYIYLSPEYDGATYAADGSANVGQMVLAYDSTNKENYYQWSSTNAALQDYDIVIRFRVPENFKRWKVTPIQFRYRTNAASTNDNKLTMTMLDTAGNAVSLTGAADLANTSWTTASITGPEASGVFTPGSYATLLVKTFARTTNTGQAHAGYINLNWSTKNP